uniref:Galactosidase, beta 1-like n=1 Tax=Astyanax mexicanus TaxID=7994 RepID=A0A3B1IHI3_ASTMX
SKNLNTVTTTCVYLDRKLFPQRWKPFQYISGSIHYSRMYMISLKHLRGRRMWSISSIWPNQTGLLVILRPGPFYMRPRGMGGLPAWLLHNPNIILRSADSDYLQAVSDWMAVLLTKMRPWLYQNGGNIISVQVENEYGSYFACDYNYLRHLRTLFRFFLGEDVFLFTTDGNTDKELICGTLEGLYATIDFGTDTNITTAFKRQRRFEPKGPLVNSEFYTGWLDHWGDKHASVETQKVSRMLEDMLSMGASVNMWVKVLTIVGNVSGLLDTLCPQGPVQSHHPPAPAIHCIPVTLPLPVCVVFVCAQVYQGVLERDVTLVMNVTGRQGDQLDILVENMGRVNFGNKINDYKAGGINVPPKPKTKEGRGPAVYSGILKTPAVAWDTFLKLTGWTKGQVWINGVNLGRYWPKRGPQQTLYVPGTLLSPSLPNNITMLELESEPDHLRVLFMDRPQLNNTRPQS